MSSVHAPTVSPADERPRHERRGRRALRWLRRGLAALALLLVALAVLGVWFVRRPWPETRGMIAVAGLSAPVEVVRDRWGVPHLYARNERDLLLAQGYVHAQDRFWQMEFTRRTGDGTLSAAAGAFPLEFDRAMRTLGLRRAAEREWRAMDPWARSLLEAYSAGVNAYLERHRGRLPLEVTLVGFEPEPWGPVDSLVWGKVLYWGLAENQTFEISRSRFIARAGETASRDLLPPYRAGAPLVVPPGETYGWMREGAWDGLDRLAAFLGSPGPHQGSNAWAIAGRRTESGRPLLANDTHIDMTMPSIWYENGLHGGRFDVVGYSFPGVPLVVIGHNRRVAWGVTDLLPDVQDYYVEELDDPEDPRRYRFRGEWRPLEVREEVIAVKGGEPVRLTVRSTHHGPLMNDVVGRLKRSKARPMALAWTAYEGRTLIRSLAQVNLARDWPEFRRAVALWDGPHLAFVYADIAGNVGFQTSGRVPIRVPGHQGLLPVPGWTGDYEWRGFIPYEEMPHMFNPAAGYVVAANNKLTGDDYPYHLAWEWADPYRAMRIHQALAADPRFGVEDTKRLQADTYSIPAATLRPLLLAVRPEGDLERRALAEVARWDLRLDPGSAGAAIYQVWYRNLVRETVRDELGDELAEEYVRYDWIHMPAVVALVEAASPWFDDVRTPAAERAADVSRRSFAAAVEWLAGQLGGDPAGWTWGRIHTVTFRHRPLGYSGIPPLERLFNAGPLPAPGDRSTVNAAWFSYDEARPFAANGGASQRLILDLGDLDGALAVQNTGQSGHLFHPGRERFVEMWRRGEYHPLLFTRRAVASHADATLTLTPREESR